MQLRMFLLFACLLLVTGSVVAVDGVIEINQARALAGGVTTADTPGFPVTIGAPGSYRLTGNLTLSSVDDTGILVVTGNVTIDLNGFTIQGVTVCTGLPVTNCAPVAQNKANYGYGITKSLGSVGVANITVKNGVIQGMGKAGLSLGMHTHVINVHAIGNNSAGISVLGDSIVKGCITSGNGRWGINLNRSINDPEIALSVIQDNVSTGNKESGILISNAAALVTGNALSNNGGYGLSGGGLETGYSNNIFLSNAGGTISGGVSLGSNLCNGSTTCP